MPAANTPAVATRQGTQAVQASALRPPPRTTRSSPSTARGGLSATDGHGQTHLLNHLLELLLLVLLEGLVVLHRRHVQLVLGLRLRRLERTREDGDLGVLHLLRGQRSPEGEGEGEGKGTTTPRGADLLWASAGD